jgi:flagellar protein FliO/FliZ
MDTSLVVLLVRVVVSLGIVLAVMAGAAAVLRRSGVVGTSGMGKRGGLRRRRGPAEVEVLLRQPVGRRASISVVRAGNRALLLGITEHTITLLAEDDPDVLVPLAPETPRTASPADGRASASPAWTAVVDALRDRTVRRS